MKNLIVANWKMNPGSQKQAEEIFNGIKKGAGGASAEVVVCPPFVYLPLLKGLPLGAQNIFYLGGPALTGGISGAMLTDLGVEYAIVGHSESRRYFKETDETVNNKIKEAIDAGLKVIFCIGETTEERDEGKKNEVLERQIKLGLAGISNFKLDPTGSLRNQISNLAIAYEPVWAIGTGNNCSVEETKKSLGFIRKFVNPDTRVLYGGSVKSENSRDYIKKAGANGLLVGGASLNAEEFIEIVKSAE